MLKNSIPFVDLRGKTLIDLLRAYPDKARDLVRASRRTYGLASYAASALTLPLADKWSHQWLERTHNPYLHEIESFAGILEMRGAYALNMCFEWGCTSGAWRTDETISLLRVLDWPFPAMGQHVLVALQSGKAGEFYNVTWPAVTGVFTGMAPARFSAALNQAPMRMHGKSYIGDWVVNRMMVEKESGLPPAHLLRQVFEQASDYEAAKEMLVKTPIALPAIYILAGLKPGEGCVIERLENAAEVFELSAGQSVYATNHFTGAFAGQGKGWHPREIDSLGRYRQSNSIGGHDINPEHFNWLQAPMINARTKLAVLADAAGRKLMAQGFEGSNQVTEVFNLPAVAYEQQQAV